MAKACIFCEIIAGHSPGHVVFQDDTCTAFLDTHPLFEGHVLLVPKAHHETIMDLPPSIIEPLFANAQKLSKAVQKAMASQGIFIAANNIVSQSVPHLHIHIVPRNKKDGLYGFFWPRKKYESPERMEAVRSRIAGQL
ncbi:MAG: HIT family protein [Chitinophagales bacterium]|nr:HIT family protein [Chitinophagales bacterium]